MKTLLQLVKQKRSVQIALGLFVLYNLVGFLLVPWLIRSVIPGQISERFLNGGILVERAVVNPYTFGGRVEGVALSDADGGIVAELETAFVNLDPIRSLFTWRYAVSAIEVNSPSANVTLLEDGSPSLLSLLKPMEPRGDAGDARISLPLAVVDAFSLSNGKVSLTDEWIGGGFSEEVLNINISALDFSTDPESDNEITLSAETANGAKMSWGGGIQFDPLSSTGTLRMDDFRSDVYEPYYRKLFAADLSTEGLSVSMDYILDPADEAPKIQIFNTRLEQANVALSEPGGGRTLLGAQRIVMDGIAVDFIEGAASMRSLVVDGELFFASRDKNNEINLMKHLLPKGFESGEFQLPEIAEPEFEMVEAIPAEEGQRDILYAIQRAVVYLQSMIELAWQVEMDHLEIKNREIELRDENLVTPATLVVESFDLLITELSNQEGADAQINISLFIRGGGRIEVSGSVTPFPTTMQLSYKIEDIDLSVISPYLQTLNKSELQSGRFRTEGELFVDFTTFIDLGALPELKIEGSLEVDAFAFLEPSGETVLSWESLEVRNYSAATEPEYRLELEEVKLVSPYASLEVLEDGTLSWQKLVEEALATGEVPSEETIVEAPEPAPSEQPLYAMEVYLPVAIEVASVTVEDGSFEVKDQFYGPGFQTKWDSLSASISPLTTADETPIQISASGVQANGSRFESSIALTNPLLIEREIEATFTTEVLATPFSPYAAQVVGFPVEEGRVAVDAEFTLSRDAVDARVKIDMDQFTLGDKADVDDVMIKLPVKLAISLMKDREGKVDLPEVKVDGSLKDPDFNVGEVVIGVFVNMIKNAATKPFFFIAGAFGGGDAEDLERIVFEPGRSTMPVDQSSKLKVLSDALFNRPQLSLVIEGYSDPVAELDAAKRLKLSEALQQFVGLNRGDQLKVLYHDRLPEAFAAFQIEGLNQKPVEPPQEESAEMAEEVIEDAPLEGRRGMFSLVNDLIDAVLPDGGSEQPVPHAPAPEGLDSDLVAVETGPSPWAEHPALANRKLIFPDAATIENALLETIEVPDDYWSKLAAARSSGVQKALFSVREFADGRVTLATPEPSEEAPAMVGIRFKLE